MRIPAFLGVLLALPAGAWGQSLLGESEASPYDPPARPSFRRHDFLKILVRRAGTPETAGRATRPGATAAESPMVITAEVADVRPNGTLVVQAVRRRRLGDQEEVIRLTGEVAPASIKEGAVLLEEVQGLNVVYEGPGRSEALGLRGFLSGLLAKVWPL